MANSRITRLVDDEGTIWERGQLWPQMKEGQPIDCIVVDIFLLPDDRSVDRYEIIGFPAEKVQDPNNPGTIIDLTLQPGTFSAARKGIREWIPMANARRVQMVEGVETLAEYLGKMRTWRKQVVEIEEVVVDGEEEEAEDGTESAEVLENGVTPTPTLPLGSILPAQAPA